MSLLEFMQRLAVLVPRSRRHLTRFHGVLAPHAKLRAQVVPTEPTDDAEARLHCEVVEHEPDDGHRWGAGIGWTLRLEPVFEIDMLHCPDCGGRLKVIAAVLDTPVIERILAHLGLPARAPPRSPLRAPMPHAP